MADPQAFQPHPFFPGGHLQTLAGFYWPSEFRPYQARLEFVQVSENDSIALHDDCPDGWAATDRVVLMIHGLAGSHTSGYMVRLMDRLTRRGIRCFRMDMRGTGAATGRAVEPGHAGRTEDVDAAIETIKGHCPDAPLSLVGFSMGGNIALSTAANASKRPIGNLQQCIAVCPPVDLSKCCRELRTGMSRFYDRYLIRFLLKIWEQNGGGLPNGCPRSIYEFDELVTAPLSGFRNAEHYYEESSSGPRLVDVDLPTTILAAQNDPVVAYSAIADAKMSQAVTLVTTKSGGHLGYFGSKQKYDDGRWMDWQLSNWICR